MSCMIFLLLPSLRQLARHQKLPNAPAISTDPFLHQRLQPAPVCREIWWALQTLRHIMRMWSLPQAPLRWQSVATAASSLAWVCVVTRLTLRLVDAYDVRQRVYGGWVRPRPLRRSPKDIASLKRNQLESKRQRHLGDGGCGAGGSDGDGEGW